ncbi:hypothetical protein AAFF_G00145610 [Aldrovandia affinis]|uniref:RGS domain-containing protein n=1 Tax=Aldrovandia affinis TaxID=143900 RepID=A0AAD7T0S4_9TELE|nr:hypothetical protein AAFF_G00145610 [Aldrovandia affinis]
MLYDILIISYIFNGQSSFLLRHLSHRKLFCSNGNSRGRTSVCAHAHCSLFLTVRGVGSEAGTFELGRGGKIFKNTNTIKERMCFRKRNGYRPPDHFNGKIYTGPVPAEQDSMMVQSEAPPLALPTQRPCCFCWCCWNSLPPQPCCRSGEERSFRRKSRETKLETLSNCEACSKPSREEMGLWAESFERLMRNPAGRNLFREFLRTEYSEDNMLFWLACEDLKQEHSKMAIQEKARLIYEDYVSILSPREVSLDSRVREVINRRMQDPTPLTFEDAQLQIYTLMHRDSYPRFLISSVYRALLHTGSCSSLC